jgi:hypothetical protein
MPRVGIEAANHNTARSIGLDRDLVAAAEPRAFERLDRERDLILA